MTGNTAEATTHRPTPRTLPEYQGFTRDLQKVILNLTGFKVWTSDAGALYATRVRDLTDAERAADLAQTVGADTPLGLADAITAQLRKATEATAKAASKTAASDDS